ncbi:YbaB/EbfC family nucleoid-associated protein [uncultured Cohaesibacter sp.]|uniref:YbaB/EbfC family nucleoid-associated protein n=1 Tax=uncultured Cohaesibacter sp. TaxID=1002546 RepID=UPI0029317014|nr:YbaB/EbfC family nucleoid-associated protein [uncultured Cohaesibacter sp.]
MDMMKMMKKAKEMQSKMAEMQEQVAQMEATGVAGGDMVKVILTGKGEMKGLSIDPSMINADDAEILEDLIIAAHNDAKAKAEAMMQEKMQEMAGDLGLPAGMNLPF